MRFLGIRWLIDLNYKDVFNLDLVKETKHFYKLFLDINLSDDKAREILGIK
ncbi:hypothetical protein [Campylobacter gastrosuis]|uniref:Uncharacterized protein n=1 Tax=Campylobacter gastrosuis TaxID=2974576 RepID=A0ABT7HRS0_9BACT|nr:hypothetical protein [Campylobacter gastrosuis]MDL0089596.1 hypothetical protein [Campylobacter gastrosuis]